MYEPEFSKPFDWEVDGGDPTHDSEGPVLPAVEAVVAIIDTRHHPRITAAILAMLGGAALLSYELAPDAPLRSWQALLSLGGGLLGAIGARIKIGKPNENSKHRGSKLFAGAFVGAAALGVVGTLVKDNVLPLATEVFHSPDSEAHSNGSVIDLVVAGQHVKIPAPEDYTCRVPETATERSVIAEPGDGYIIAADELGLPKVDTVFVDATTTIDGNSHPVIRPGNIVATSSMCVRNPYVGTTTTAKP